MNPVDKAISERKTVKILAEKELDCPEKWRETVQELLAVAGMAPFHRACDPNHRESGVLSGIEPWRFHILSPQTCRKLGPTLDPEKAGKIPKMLAAADCLLVATWLPNPSSETLPAGQLFDASLGNMEHIAAASSAIQNLLVAATIRGIRNYWSSGGILREATTFEKLGIPQSEILLGAIFLFPQETGDAQVAESKLRPKRTTQENWSRCVELLAGGSQQDRRDAPEFRE